MSTFDEMSHPRGQALNAGQFRTKDHDAPGGALTVTSAAEGTAHSPLWCANDDTHPEHWGHNSFGGRDYCSGRPSVHSNVRARASQERIQRIIEECIGQFPEDEPLLYEPTDGQHDGYTDVVAVDHSTGQVVKFTIDPDDTLTIDQLNSRTAEPVAPAQAETQAADSVMRAFISQHALHGENSQLGNEDPATTIGWSLGDKVPYEALRDLVVEAQRDAHAKARASAIGAAARLWGPSAKIPPFDELESGVTGGPRAYAVEYLRGQIETIGDAFGCDESDTDDSREAIYREIVTAVRA